MRKELEELFLLLIKKHKLPLPEREVRLNPKRKWRYDFVWRKQKLIVEIEGGVWLIGGHQRPKAFIKDCEKYNWAVVNGYKLLRYTKENIDSFINDLKTLLLKKKPL